MRRNTLVPILIQGEQKLPDFLRAQSNQSALQRRLVQISTLMLI
jgi:hypothetical protein